MRPLSQGAADRQALQLRTLIIATDHAEVNLAPPVTRHITAGVLFSPYAPYYPELFCLSSRGNTRSELADSGQSWPHAPTHLETEKKRSQGMSRQH